MSTPLGLNIYLEYVQPSIYWDLNNSHHFIHVKHLLSETIISYKINGFISTYFSQAVISMFTLFVHEFSISYCCTEDPLVLTMHIPCINLLEAYHASQSLHLLHHKVVDVNLKH